MPVYYTTSTSGAYADSDTTSTSTLGITNNCSHISYGTHSFWSVRKCKTCGDSFGVHTTSNQKYCRSCKRKRRRLVGETVIEKTL